jgi:hypothetical protein
MRQEGANGCHQKRRPVMALKRTISFRSGGIAGQILTIHGAHVGHQGVEPDVENVLIVTECPI